MRRGSKIHNLPFAAARRQTEPPPSKPASILEPRARYTHTFTAPHIPEILTYTPAWYFADADLASFLAHAKSSSKAPTCIRGNLDLHNY